MTPNIALEELLAYTIHETRRWREFFEANSAALDVRLDIPQAPDARSLVLHILGVELIYSEMLYDREITDFSKLPFGTLDELFAIGEAAQKELRRFLDHASEDDWKAPLKFPRRWGALKATKRKAFAHTLFHGMRHWAQLATELRSAGFKQGWQHDFIFTNAVE